MIRTITGTISRTDLQYEAEQIFGDFVKAVVDVRRQVMAIGGELHADEESFLLEEGSVQHDLWGINIYPGQDGEAMIEFDSMINLRPTQGNRTRAVDDAETRKQIIRIVTTLVE